jgi:4-hydroxy-4-methyl-2-oxoglutarate aldolase
MNPRNPSPAHHAALTEDEFRDLAALDTCSVANAIERFNLRLRNEGFTEGSITCRFPQLPPMLGYAVTLQVRSSAPPTKGTVYSADTHWWDALQAVPAPRILVVQDMDRIPGAGAMVGELHAKILQRLGCVGLVTNGAVRDLPGVEPLRFQMYSGTLSVSHSYSHVVHAGDRVQIGGLEINAGDLLHGDVHGVLRVPKELAARIPPTALALRRKEGEIVAYCESPEFSVEGLRALLDGQSF